MAASIESRTPLLDYRIAEASLSLPPSWFVTGGVNKDILVQAFREDLPRIGPKRGFVCPLHQWLMHSGVVAAMNGLVSDTPFLMQLMRKGFEAAALTPRQAWMLVSVCLWYHLFIDGDMDVAVAGPMSLDSEHAMPSAPEHPGSQRRIDREPHCTAEPANPAVFAPDDSLTCSDSLT